MQKLAQGITDQLVQNNIVKPEDADSCRYGLELMFSSVSEILCVLVISLFAGNFAETVVFFIAFMPLRIYGGGYHADTRLRCFLILLAAYGVLTALLMLLPLEAYRYVIFGGSAFTLIAVIALAPVRHNNKHLSENEVRVYRKIAVGVCIAEAAAALVGGILAGESPYILSFVCGQLAVSLSMIAACIKINIAGR